MPNIPRPMQIFIASIPYDDGNGEKTRPALVIKPSLTKTGVLKITSQYESKSPAIQRLYFTIKHWREAGLNKPSYVDIHTVYAISTSTITARRPIGKLAQTDVYALLDLVRATEAHSRNIGQGGQYKNDKGGKIR